MSQQIILCSGTWENVNGTPVCSGVLSSAAYVESPSGLTAEDWAELRGHALELFALVFGVLILKKVATMR